MSIFPRTTSVAARLTRMNLLVSGTALILAAIAFFSYDLFSFRQSLIDNIEAEARIVGENSVSAVMFNDQLSATNTLQSLASSSDIRTALLATNDGTVFAEYKVPWEKDVAPEHTLTATETDNAWFSGRRVLVAHRIVFQGKSVGVVYISATLTEIGQRARHYLWIAGIILLLCMGAALLISSAARRYIAQPIISLAETARVVSREKDYSRRATLHTDSSEIAILINSFNAMLDQIQERDAALIKARNELELRVEERTAELQNANRELEAFSYTVAHDLRGPLDAISGIAFLLAQTQKESGSQAQEMLQQLKTSTSNMGTLIDDLLNFSRATTSTLKYNPVDISEIAREIAAELHRSDPQRNVEFIIHDIPIVRTDAGLMRVVLDNLLRNAWKYTSHHATARIEVGSREASDQTIYFVRDDGAGFNPAMMEQLFRPFQRLHSKGEFPGTGIGLATVQRILARQGGRIWAEAAVEKGATFFFTF